MRYLSLHVEVLGNYLLHFWLSVMMAPFSRLWTQLTDNVAFAVLMDYIHKP